MQKFLIILLRFYQLFLSSLKFPVCRFTPSCSSYALQAVNSYGAWKGLKLSLARFLKCHPFHPGGYDPVDKKDNQI